MLRLTVFVILCSCCLSRDESFRNLFVQKFDKIIEKELEEDAKVTYPKEYCERVWPSIDLFLPVNIVPYLNAMHINTANEWTNIFLSTYLNYWPIKISKTKVTFVIDEEHVNNKSINAHRDFLTTVHSYFDSYPEAQFQIVTNNFTEEYWVHGRWRQQLVGFYADHYVKSDYVGYVDGDSAFVTYVDREDLFDNGRPIVRGRFGAGFVNFFTLPAEWLLGGLKEPVKCMSYFPVLIKTVHIKQMRDYIEQVHGKPFLKVFHEWITRPKHQRIVAHFHPMCIYIWHFHRDEYSWHSYGTTGDINDHYNTTKQVLDSNFTDEMLTPRPHIAVHFPYHHFIYTSEYIFFGGYCHGPPFPKSPDMESQCQSLQKYNEYPLSMNNFEWSDSDNENNHFRDYVMKYDKIRHRRIEQCNHKYNMSLIRYDRLKSHVKR